MAVRKQTIKQQLEQIKRLRPNFDEVTGMLYATKRDLKRKHKKVTLFGLFVSDERTFLIRPHLFETSTARDAYAWADWFSGHYGEIMRENILPGMETRTGKQWRLYRIIGWAEGDNTGFNRAKKPARRNKAKPQRSKNGRNHTRRRQ